MVFSNAPTPPGGLGGGGHNEELILPDEEQSKVIRLITEDFSGDLLPKSESDLAFLQNYVNGFDFLQEYKET
jgi:hypothetical protein